MHKSWYEKQFNTQFDDVDEHSDEFMEAQAMIAGKLEYYIEQGIPEVLARRRVFSDIYMDRQVVN